MANSVIKDSNASRIDAHTLGTMVNLDSYTLTEYVAPCDGYLQISVTNSNGKSLVLINNTFYASAEYGSKSSVLNMYNVVFIKKGMTLKVTMNGGTVNFFPLV